MSNKMLIVFVLVMLIIIVFIINLVANSFKDDGTRYQEKTPGMITVEEQEQVEKTYAQLIDEADKINSKYKASNYNSEYISLTDNERATIDNVIDEVLGYISSQNVDEIYDNHTAVDYRVARFPNKEEMKKYMEATYDLDASYSVKSYEIKGNSLIIPITETKLGSDMQLSDIKVGNCFSPDYYLFFDNVQELLGLTNTYKNKDFRINIFHCIAYVDHFSLIFQIENDTNSTIDFDFENTYVREPSGKIFNSLPLLGDSRVSAAPGKTTIYEAKFDKYKVYPDSIIFNIKYGGKTIENDKMYLLFDSTDLE